MSIALLTLSPKGLLLAQTVARRLPGCEIFAPQGIAPLQLEGGAGRAKGGIGSSSCNRCQDEKAPLQLEEMSIGVRPFETIGGITAELFDTVEGVVFFAPAGVAVRSIAPHLVGKTVDPAVVVVDVGHRHAISLLCGHEGGANLLAVRIANILDAEPVISTTTEAQKTVIAGIGCRRGVETEQILEALKVALGSRALSPASLRLLATIELKHDERAILQAAQILGIPLRLIALEEINAQASRFERSEFVQQHLGVPAVAEPCALLAGRRTRLLVPRIKSRGVTVALAQERCLWSESAPETRWTAPSARSGPSPNAASSSGTEDTSSWSKTSVEGSE